MEFLIEIRSIKFYANFHKSDFLFWPKFVSKKFLDKKDSLAKKLYFSTKNDIFGIFDQNNVNKNFYANFINAIF